MSGLFGRGLVPQSAPPKKEKFTTLDLETFVSSGFLDVTHVGVVLHDEAGVVLQCNNTAAHLFGTTVEDFLGRAFLDAGWGIVHEDGTAFRASDRPEMIDLREEGFTENTILGFDVMAKARRWLRVTTSLAVDQGVTVGVISSFVDITQQIQHDHTMRLMREINRFAMTSTDEVELFQRLCDELVATGDYSLAWIGEPSAADGGVVHVCYAAGESAYLYDDIVSTLAWKETGVGPTGTALREGVTQVANDLERHPLYHPWSSRASRFGFSSSIAVPFFPGGRPLVLSIYDRHPFNFDEVTVQGLEEIAREIEHGVAAQRSIIDIREALDQTSEAMRVLAESERVHSLSEQRFRSAFEDNMAPMSFSDPNDLVLAVNDAFCDMVGYSRDELLGRDSTLFTFPEDYDISQRSHAQLLSHDANQVRFVKRYLRKNGQVVVAEVSRSTARDAAGGVLYFVSSERDITAERELASELSHQALHDPLTGLANRTLLADRLNHALARANRDGEFVAALMIDLDDFKGVNDTYGHLVGDQLLRGVADRLGAVARPSDSLCRFGGDEFLYLAEGLRNEAEADEIAKRFLTTMEEPFRLGAVEIIQHASIGVVVWDANSPECFSLIENADVALYEAKRQRKGNFQTFDASMRNLAASHFTLRQELCQALQQGELAMHYQPIVDLETRDILGFEALMRWQHPQKGLVSPEIFIPLAERSDIIVDLGNFALREAIKVAGTWSSNGIGTRPFVSVNLSAKQFHDPDLVTVIDQSLRASGLDAGRLILEITETSALLDVTETLKVLRVLKSRGIGLALDDFGTGFSSLSYLIQLEPRFIKIDQSFVSPSVNHDQNELLLESIISLGKKLDITLFAEGIETVAQREKLLRLGCRFGQGYLYWHALAANEVEGLLGEAHGRGGARLAPSV